MKQVFFCFLILCALGLSLSTTVKGQEVWSITDFHSDIVVRSDGVLDIKETIAVDFNNLDKHGIFRNIPYIYSNSDGSKTYLEIEVSGVSREGYAEPYSQSYAENEFVLKIGDADKTISGSQNYLIEYTVIGALLGYERFDELYWNSTGNYWEVEIKKATTTVRLPVAVGEQASCYQGSFGSNEQCSATEISKTEYNFGSTRTLPPGEGLTVALGFTKGTIPLLVGQAPKTVVTDLLKPLNLTLSVGLFLIGLGLIAILWRSKGRDFWFGRNYLFGSKEELAPVGAKETIVVEYSPPENLRPAELAALLDERADTIDVTATLVDLAGRGFLTITEESKKWAFGSRDYIFEKVDKPTKELLEYEEELLSRLFDDSQVVRMSELKNKFYKDLAVVKEKLYLNLTSKKFFVESPDKVRGRYSLIAILIGFVGGGLILLGFSLTNSLLLELGVVVIVLAVVFLIIAQLMPRRTALGRKLYTRAKGYKLFIETAEKHRQQFFEKKNLFNEVLPYAVVFGLTEKFAKAFAQMGLEQSQPSWYRGRGAFNAIAFGSAMNSLSTTVSSSIASSPSSSGSGGGGSSGGGFGGGGGGSW